MEPAETKPEEERLLGDAGALSPSNPENNRAEDGDSETYTLEEGINALGAGTFQILLMLYVGLAWVSDAMEMMLLSFLGPAVACLWDLSENQKSSISSVVFIGMMLGAWIWGAVSDAKGRKVGFCGTAVLTAIAGFASALAPNYISLLIFRGLVGFGLGGVPVAFGLFLEFVPSKSRGRLAILMESSWTIGALVEAGMAWAILPTMGWRALLLFSTIPLVLLLVLFPLLPESPHYLVSKGRLQEAEVVLAKIAKINKKPLPPGRLVAPKTIQPSTGERKGCFSQIASGVSGLFTELGKLFSRKFVRTSLLVDYSWFANAFCYYGLVLLTTELHTQEQGGCNGKEMPDISNKDYLDIFITTSAESVGILFAFFLIDFIGRIKSMAGFLAVCSLSLVPLVIFDLSAHQATIFLFAGRAGSMASFITIYAYTTEVYPTSIRAFGLGFSTAWSRVGGLVAPFAEVGMVDGGHTRAAELMLIGMSALAVIATVLLPIETAGRELRDDYDEEDEEEKEKLNVVN